MRWKDTCTLVSKSYAPDDEGVLSVTDERTEVFCNPFTVGAHTWSSMYEIGISADAELQVHSLEYDGQRDVLFKGKWYSVETVKEEGDFVRLVLRHQASDTDDDPNYGSEGDEGGGNG